MDEISQEASVPQAHLENEPVHKNLLNEKGSFLLILGAVVIILVVLGAGGYLLTMNKNLNSNQYASQPTPTSIQPTSSNETANWKIYKNEKFGYEVKYPPEWTVAISDLDGNTLITDGSFKFEIHPTLVGRGLDTTPTRESEIVVEGIVGNRKDFLTEENKVYLSHIRFHGYSIKGWDSEYNYILLDASSQVDYGNSSMESMAVKAKDLTNFKILDQILATFKFLDQNPTDTTDESSVKDLVLNFYRAFEKEDGSTLFKFMTSPLTSQEKGEYSWLTGADLGANAFYRAFLRVKLANLSIKNVNLVDDKTFQVTATDELQGYSQVTEKWSEPTLRNVKFTVIKTPVGWLIDKFTYTGTVTWTYKGTEKYNGLPNLETN